MSREFKVCLWLSRSQLSKAKRENSRDVFLQNLRRKRKKLKYSIAQSFGGHKKDPRLAANTDTLVNERKIYKFLAWKFLRYNYSGYTRQRRPENERKNPLNRTQFNNNNSKVEVYACSQFLGAISINCERFSLRLGVDIKRVIVTSVSRRCCALKRVGGGSPFSPVSCATIRKLWEWKINPKTRRYARCTCRAYQCGMHVCEEKHIKLK